jgi:malate dehydrogenase (oxaloacetate-decarboxylating)(NADP+)
MTIALLPPHLADTDHRQRCFKQMRDKDSALEKYIYLSALKDRDPTLFFEMLLENMMVRFFTYIPPSSQKMLMLR